MINKFIDFYNQNLRTHSFLIFSILVILVSFFTYFLNYQQPSAPFWDENYHIASAQKYIDGVWFVELHPPLGKMLIALGELIIQPNNDNRIASEISEFTAVDYIKSFPQGMSYAGYRFFPALLAFLSGYLIFILFYLMSKKELLAFLFSSLYLFDNALIVHSRAAMLEGIQIFFILLSIITFIYFYNYNKFKWFHYLILGSLIGLVVSVKINGLIILPIAAYLYLKDGAGSLPPSLAKFFESEGNTAWLNKNNLSRFFGWGLAKAGITIAGLVLVFGFFQYLHFNIAKNVQNDNYYTFAEDLTNDQAEDKKQADELNKIDSSIQDILNNNTAANPINTPVMWAKWQNHQRIHSERVPALDVCKEGENGSFPLGWIIGNKSINYRWERYVIEKPLHNTYWPININSEENKDKTIPLDTHAGMDEEQKSQYVVPVKYLYLQGNPLIWIVALISVSLSLVLILGTIFFGLEIKNHRLFGLICLFTLLYVTYLLSVLTVERVLYLYHYFVPLIFSFIISMLLFQYKFYDDINNQKLRYSLYMLTGFWVIMIFFSFIFFAPFSYYLPLTTEEFEMRNWVKYWGLKVVK